MAPQRNPTQLGDPVSLKAETSKLVPTEDDLGAQSKDSGKEKPSLKELAQKNPTQLGGPISLKAETSKLVPTEDEQGAKTKSKL